VRCIIAGSRTATKQQVKDALAACPFTAAITTVVSGTARGADTFGEEWAAWAKKAVVRYPADWDRYGKRAGYVRNQHMAENAEALLAVWDGASRGTGHMIDLANRHGLIVFVHRTDLEKST
jgi:hypothetical protein